VFASDVVGDGTNAYVTEALEKVLERVKSRAGMDELTILATYKHRQGRSL
jgi:hypothetical protein